MFKFLPKGLSNELQKHTTDYAMHDYCISADDTYYATRINTI